MLDSEHTTVGATSHDTRDVRLYSKVKEHGYVKKTQKAYLRPGYLGTA